MGPADQPVRAAGVPMVPALGPAAIRRSPMSSRTFFSRSAHSHRDASGRRKKAIPFAAGSGRSRSIKSLDHFRKLGREPGGAGGTDAQIRFATLPAAPRPRRRRLERATSRSRPGRPRPRPDPRRVRGSHLAGILAHRRRGPSPQGGRDRAGHEPGAVRVAKSRVLRRLREELGESP